MPPQALDNIIIIIIIIIIIMQMETPARNHCMSVGMTDIGRLTVSSASDNRMT
jgi:hypothetical protein